MGCFSFHYTMQMQQHIHVPPRFGLAHKWSLKSNKKTMMSLVRWILLAPIPTPATLLFLCAPCMVCIGGTLGEFRLVVLRWLNSFLPAVNGMARHAYRHTHIKIILITDGVQYRLFLQLHSHADYKFHLACSQWSQVLSLLIFSSWCTLMRLF